MKDDERQKLARLQLIRKQVSAGDPICAEYLSLIALNSRAGGGRSWIETQLDMEDDYDDADDGFRPY